MEKMGKAMDKAAHDTADTVEEAAHDAGRAHAPELNPKEYLFGYTWRRELDPVTVRGARSR